MERARGTAERPGGGGSVIVEAVSKSFNGVQAVNSVTLSVQPGEFLTLLGPSGCGKTTLMRMIAGLETPTAGRILIGGADVTASPPEARPANMVFQRYALFPHLDVAGNIAYGLLAKGVGGDELRRRVTAALDLVHMTGFAGRAVRELSGGQAQRVALARALVNEPQVLLLDEPLSALDLQLRNRMQVELRAIHRRLRTTFIFVTHDQGEALAMSDRIAVMDRGQIAQAGTPAEIYRSPATRFVAGFVGESSFVPVKVIGVKDGRATVTLAGGGEATAAAGAGAKAGQDMALMLRPEGVRLTKPEDGRLRGRLRDVMFFGAVHRILVQLPEGTEIKLDSTVQPSAALDSAVGIGWDDKAAVLVEAS
ncbi:MAG: ABC transporter ATP-binding protein [Parvibaculaceae bacterium]